MTVTILDDATAWNAYVGGHPDSTGYHQWAWRDVFADAFGHASLYLAAGDGAQITGVLPLVEFRSRLFGTFAVSLPFVNYGGIVADDEGAAVALSARAESLASPPWRRMTSVRLMLRPSCP